MDIARLFRSGRNQAVRLPKFLPIDLGWSTGQTFVLRREHEHHPRIQALLASLKQGCLELAEQHPEVSTAFAA